LDNRKDATPDAMDGMAARMLGEQRERQCIAGR
jgi:hypothetical protein